MTQKQVLALLICALVVNVECRIPETGVLAPTADLLGGDAAKLLGGAAVAPAVHNLVSSLLENETSEEDVKTKLMEFLQVKSETGEPVSLALLISGLVILGITGVVKISKIAAKKYTQHEIEKAHGEVQHAQRDFCRGLDEIVKHSELQERVSDMMMVWAQERAEESGDKAVVDTLIQFTNRLSTMLRVINGHSVQHARNKADEVCPGMITPSKEADRSADYWEAQLNDPALDIKKDVVELILLSAKGATMGIHSKVGGLTVSGLKVLKDIICDWNDEAAAKMIAKHVGIEVVKQILQAFVPQAFVAILAVECALAIGDFVVDIGNFWEKVLQAQSQAKKDVLNYYFVICSMLQKQADSENLRNTLLKDLVNHVNSLKMESIAMKAKALRGDATHVVTPELNEAPLTPASELDAAAARDLAMKWIQAAKQRASSVERAGNDVHYPNTKLLLKDICANYIIHDQAVYESSFPEKVFTDCTTLSNQPIADFDWSITERVFGALTVENKSNTYATSRFPKACPGLYNSVRSGKDRLLVKQVTAVPTEFFQTEEMGQIIDTLVNKDPHFNFIDGITGKKFDKTQTKQSFLFWAQDSKLQNEPVTDFIKVPVRRSWVVDMRKRTGDSAKYVAAIRQDDIRAAVDMDHPLNAGLNIDSLASTGSQYQALGLPCFITRLAFSAYRNKFISTFQNVFGSKTPPGATVTISGEKHWPEEVDSSIGQYDTCFPVVFGAKDKYLGLVDMQPYMIFAVRGDGAPAVHLDSESKRKAKDDPAVYVSQLRDDYYFYYDKMDVRDPNDYVYKAA